MLRIRFSHILQVLGVATIAISFSGAAMAAENAGAVPNNSPVQATQDKDTSQSNSSASHVVVQISTDDRQATAVHQTDSAVVHEAAVSIKGVEAKDVTVAVDMSASTSASAPTHESTHPDTLASALKQAVDVADKPVVTSSSSIAPVKPFIVSQTQIVSASQAIVATSNPATANDIESSASSNNGPRPFGGEVPSLPGTIAQRLGSVITVSASTYTPASLSSSSSWLPMLLSLLSALCLLGLLAIGSLYLARLRASGFQGAGRGLPFKYFATDRILSFTGALSTLAGSFFNRQNTYDFKLSLT